MAAADLDRKGIEKERAKRKEALNFAYSQIERQYGKGSIMRLGDRGHVQIRCIPTGSLGLDLALGCDILALDEPSAGLDPITAANLDRTILSLRKNLGFTFVVVTHELQSIFTIADRAVMLDPVSRSIIAEGKPAELRDRSTDPRVRQFFNREPDQRKQTATS